MKMPRHAAVVAVLLLAPLVWKTGPAAQAPTPQVPLFEYDPTFPKPMRENWAIGPIGGMAVDRQDHLYVVQRPGALASNERFTGSDDTPPKADCCIPAPPVLEFDYSGTLIHSWGGPGAGYDWPQTEHGIFVDAKDTVWLAGSGQKDAQILTFTREGKFLRQFGKPGMNKGSADTNNLGQPANLTVDPVSNEVYVAGGYGNRRVIVLDAATFAFKRMWGAYGNKPSRATASCTSPTGRTTASRYSARAAIASTKCSYRSGRCCRARRRGSRSPPTRSSDGST